MKTIAEMKHRYENFGDVTGTSNLNYIATSSHILWANNGSKDGYELLWAAGGHQEINSTCLVNNIVIIARRGGVYYYSDSPWAAFVVRLKKCTLDQLRRYLKNVVDAKRNSNVVYWWRDQFKEILDELEAEELNRVPAGTERAVA